MKRCSALTSAYEITAVKCCSTGVEGGSGFGPLLPFALLQCVQLSARRGRGHPPGAHAGAVCASLRLHCAARPGVAPHNSLRSLRSLRSNRRGESGVEARWRAPTPVLRCSSPQKSPPPGAPCRAPSVWCPATKNQDASARSRRSSAVPMSVGGVASKATTLAARRALPAGGDFWGFDPRSLEVGARSALPQSDSPRLFERSERSERSEFAARLQDEHHSEVGAKRRPLQHEPPAGSACRAARTLTREVERVRPAGNGRIRKFPAPTQRRCHEARRLWRAV